MFLPIGDSPNPHTKPWATRCIIALNVAVFVFVTMPRDRRLTPSDVENPRIEAAVTEMWNLEQEHEGRRASPFGLREWVQQLSLYDVFVFEHGYQPGRPSWVDLFFCMFLHANLMHLLGNMLFLWIFGDNVEARLGRLGYVVCYLLTGAAATLSFAKLQSQSLVPLVGASGAISGVLGFYLIWFPRNIVRVFVFLGFWFMDVVSISARWVLLFYLVLDNLLPFLLAGESSVAYGAHIGGFAAGMVLAFLLRRIAREEPLYDDHGRPQWGRRPGLAAAWNRWASPEEVIVEGGAPEADRRGSPGPQHLAAERSFAHAFERGNMPLALDLFRRRVAPGLEPATSQQLHDLGEWLAQYGHPSDAHSVLSHYLRRFPNGRELASVHLKLGLLLARHFNRALAAREHLLTAIDLAGPGSQIQETARAALQQI